MNAREYPANGACASRWNTKRCVLPAGHSAPDALGHQEIHVAADGSDWIDDYTTTDADTYAVRHATMREALTDIWQLAEQRPAAWIRDHAGIALGMRMGPTETHALPSAPWVDASSAPKTGEHILVTRRGTGGFGICGGEWQDWCAVVHYWANPGEEGFYLSNGASAPIDDRPMEFTHWIALPRAGQ